MNSKNLFVVLIVMAIQCIVKLNGNIDNEDHGAIIEVCVGQKIPLKVNFKNRHIHHSRILYRGKDQLMEYHNDGTHIEAERVEYHSPTWVVYKDATVNDSGRYDMLVVFSEEEGDNDWPTFEVTVFSGCPARSAFFSPAIMYKLDTGQLRPLADNGVIQVGREAAFMSINVTVPAASPPVTCTIEYLQHSTTRVGSNSTSTHCLASFQVENVENFTMVVKLEHPRMDAAAKTFTFVHISGTSSENTTGREMRDTDAEQHLVENGFNHSRMGHGLLTTSVLIVIAVLVAALVWYHRTKLPFGDGPQREPQPNQDCLEMESLN